MDSASSSKFLYIFLLSHIFMRCSSGSFVLTDVKGIMQKPYQEKLTTHRKELFPTAQDDFTNPPPLLTNPTSPLTNPTSPLTNPTSPVTNPVTTPATGTAPPDFSAPPMVTIPPAVDPTINPPFQPPVMTNPTNPGGGGGFPAAAAGQSWCVARGGAAESVIQVALDYACGLGGADCSTIQQGGSCYNPNTLQNHASVAFNSYYQKNPVQTSCDFAGAAMLTNANPSSGSCIFPSSSSSSSSSSSPPATMTTPMPTPSTDSSYGGIPAASTGSPPTVLNGSNPAAGVGGGGGLAGYGDSPPVATISSTGRLKKLKPFIVCTQLLALFIFNLHHA